MKKSITPQAPQPDDFVFVYNDQETHISKYMFALYSAKFRRIPEFFITNSLAIRDKPPFSAFCQFLRAAQGIETKITVDNALDILHFCNIWEVNSVESEVKKMMNSNMELEKAMQKIINAKKKETYIGLETVIVNNFDAALQIQTLTEFPIQSLSRIVNNPNCTIKKPHRYYRFVKTMLNRIGSEASLLAAKMDFSSLSSEEAIEFLKHPKLIKSFIADSMSDAMIVLLQDNAKFISQLTDYHNQLNSMSQRLDSLEKNAAIDHSDPSDTLKQLSKKISLLESKVGSSSDDKAPDVNTKISKALSKIESLCNDTVNMMNKSFSDIEQKAHKDLRKTNKIVNGLTKKSGLLENSIMTMRSDNSDLKNSMTTVVRKIIECEESLNNIGSQKVLSQQNQIIASYSGQPYNGIFTKLYEMANGDPHSKKLINVTASSSDRNEAYQITNSTWNDFFFTEDQPNSWIMIDFKDKKVYITNYTLRTHKFATGTCHLKSWVVEGSLNGNNWEEIDKRSTPVLNGPNRFQTFPSTKTADKFRYIRLRQTGPNFRGDNILAIASLELFGTMFI